MKITTLSFVLLGLFLNSNAHAHKRSTWMTIRLDSQKIDNPRPGTVWDRKKLSRIHGRIKTLSGDQFLLDFDQLQMNVNGTSYTKRNSNPHYDEPPVYHLHLNFTLEQIQEIFEVMVLQSRHKAENTEVLQLMKHCMPDKRFDKVSCGVRNLFNNSYSGWEIKELTGILPLHFHTYSGFLFPWPKWHENGYYKRSIFFDVYDPKLNAGLTFTVGSAHLEKNP